MLMFSLAISCLTTSNLPWFMNLKYQVPIQYHSLQHRNLLSPPETPTSGHHFRFGLASSFFLELFPWSSLGAYWTPIDPGGSSFSVIPFCLFILFMGFSRQCWSGLPFPSPVGYWHIECSTLTESSCRIWNSSAGALSPSLALFILLPDFTLQDVWLNPKWFSHFCLNCSSKT